MLFRSQAIVGRASAGVVEARLGEAHDLLTRLLICRRFLAAGAAEPGDVPENVAAMIARACGFATWAAMLAASRQPRPCVRDPCDHLLPPGSTAQRRGGNSCARACSYRRCPHT